MKFRDFSDLPKCVIDCFTKLPKKIESLQDISRKSICSIVTESDDWLKTLQNRTHFVFMFVDFYKAITLFKKLKTALKESIGNKKQF